LAEVVAKSLHGRCEGHAALPEGEYETVIGKVGVAA
jgi:hypothetical protein